MSQFAVHTSADARYFPYILSAMYLDWHDARRAIANAPANGRDAHIVNPDGAISWAGKQGTPLYLPDPRCNQTHRPRGIDCGTPFTYLRDENPHGEMCEHGLRLADHCDECERELETACDFWDIQHPVGQCVVCRRYDCPWGGDHPRPEAIWI